MSYGMKTQKKRVCFALVVVCLLAIITGIVLVSVTEKPATAAEVSPVLSGTHHWWNNKKQNGIYSDTYAVNSVPGARLSSGGCLIHANGKYYTNSASLTAYFTGITDAWAGMGDNHTAANYGKISIGETSSSAGKYCEPTTGNYEYGNSVKYASNINELKIVKNLVAGDNVVSFVLQQGTWYGFWNRQDHREASVVVHFDNVAPTGTLSGVANGGYTNQNVSFTWSDSLASATLDGNSYSKGAVISAEGSHSIVLTDLVGNSTRYNFTIDKTLPTGTFSKSGTTDSGKKYFKEDVSFSWTDSGTSISAKLDGANYIKGSNIFTEGEHSIVLSDLADNSTTYNFVIDKTVPILTIKDQSGKDLIDGATTNKLIYFTVTDTTTYSPEFTFEFRNSNNQILNEWNGFKAKTIYYDVRKIDFSDKKYSHTLFYERNELIAALKVEEYGRITSHTNWNSSIAGTILSSEAAYSKIGAAYWLYTTSEGDKYIFFAESRAKSYVDSNISKYQRSSLQNYFWGEGTVTVRVSDPAGNSTSKTITLDFTAPAGQIYSATNGFAKDDFSYSVADNLGVAYLEYLTPGNSAWTRENCSSKTFPKTSTNGLYQFRAYDRAGNVSQTLSVMLDTLSPEFSVNPFYKAGQTVSIYVTETNPDRVELDGVNQNTKRSWNTNDLSEGSHTIAVYDKAGNSTVKTFVVDKTAPVFSVNPYYKAGDTISISIIDTNFDRATLNGDALSIVNKTANISASSLPDKSYTIVVYDKAGNSTAKSFIVDKTAPVITLNEEFFKAGQTVTLSVKDANLNYYEISGIGTTSATSFATNNLEERTYILTAYDKAGNTSTKSFTVDKTAPVFNVNTYYNAAQTVQLSIKESNLHRVELDGTVTDNRNILAKDLTDGSHTIAVYDKAGNSTSKSFIVDKTAPVFSLKEFYAANETISLVIEEANLDRVELDGVQVAERSWNADNLSEGSHTIIVYDKAGNEKRADFFFKTAAPHLSIRKNGANAGSGVFLKASDSIEVVINDEQFDYMTFNGERISSLQTLGTYSWSITWTAKELAEGTHQVIIYDKAKNESTVQFTVDKTAPSLVLKVNGSVVADGTPHLNAGDSFSFTYSDVNIDRVTLDDETVTTTRYSASSLPEYSHTIVVYDKAGNIASVSFEIDKTAPAFTLEAYYNGERDILLEVVELNLSYIALDGETLDGNSVDISTLSEGRHAVSVYDKAGNSTTKSFIVDKTAPAFSLREFYNASSVILLSIIEDNLDRITLDGAATSTVSWLGSELPEGEHTVIAYDKAGNSFEQTFYIDIVAPEIVFNLNGVQTKEETVYLAANDEFSFEVYDENFQCVELNSQITQEKRWSAADLDDRTYILTAYDKAGNATTINIIVDKTAPLLTLRKNGKNVESGAYFKNNTTVSIIANDANLDRIELDDVIVDKTSWTAGELYEGEHFLSVYDKAGNCTTVSFVIDKTVPFLPLAEFYRAGEIIWLTAIEDNLDYVLLDDEPITATEVRAESLADGRHKVTVGDLAENIITVYFVVDTVAPKFTLKDFYREIDTLYLSISDANLQYVTLDDMITELTVWQCTQLYEGEHTITAYDSAGNFTSRMFVVDKTAPVVVIRKDGEQVDSMFFTASDILTLDISEEYIETVTLNGTAIENFTLICADFADNNYTLRVVDMAGNVTVVSFVIDKSAPKVTLRRNMKAIDSEGVYISAYDTVSAVISDANLDRVLFDGVETLVYSWRGAELADGKHTIVVYDYAGNITTASFIIHKAAPEFDLQEYYVMGETVTVNVSEESLDYILLDDARTFEFSWAAVELGEGVHTIVVYDKAGNNTKKSFVVDTLAPSISMLKNSKEPEEIVYAKADDTISITVSDANLDYVLFDGEKTTQRTWECKILDEKTYFIFAYDKAGNYTSVSFTVDRTAPIFELNEYYLNGETVFINVEESNPDGVYLNGERIFDFAIAADSLEERTYILTAKDKAGNVTEKSFTVDLSAPVVTVSGFDKDGEPITVAEGKNSYGNLCVSVSDIATFVLYAGHNGATAVAVGEEFTVEAAAENEGTWVFYAEDSNFYRSAAVTVTLDFTAPKIIIAGADSDEKSKGYTNTDFTVSAIDTFGYSLYYKAENTEFSLCSQTEFAVAAIAANEGAWEFYAVDVNGLKSDIRRIVFDLGAPEFALTGLVTETPDKGYTNTGFAYSANDYHFANITYKKAGGDTHVSTDGTVSIENTRENEGAWEFYAEDLFGQHTAVYTVVLNFNFDFKNVEDIRNSFKQNKWYTVTLPARIYGATSKPDISGTYTFANYETALSFAIEKEKEYRVYAVSEGGWGYVSVNNENVYTNYATEEELSVAVNHYAAAYVSTCKRFNSTESRNEYPNITDETFNPNVGAITANSPEIPEFLSGYGLPVYIARQTFVPRNNSALSPSEITMTYIGNLIGSVTPKAFEVAYGESFSAAMSRAANLYEGYYLYEERDLCGNVQRAILFIDLSEPTISATIVRGDGIENLTITKDTVGERSGVFYAVSFSINGLLDNLDGEFVSVQISGAKVSEIYTVGDDIPELNAAFGSGEYRINVYDRSFNSLTFTVIIAGQEPSWYYTSLSANSKKLSVYINKNDGNGAILSLRLVKIRSDGTYIDLAFDDENTAVSPATMNYVFTNGGKYTAIMTDIYGRTVEMTPIFYEKGLPVGTLDGVRNGGATKTDVIFSYAEAYGMKLYYDGDVRTPVSGIDPTYDADRKQYTLTVEKTQGSTLDYVIVLYLLSDEGVYIEYTFTIDCEAPLYSITAADGSPIAPNGSVNQAFVVTWGEENVSVKSQRDGFSATTYNGNLISANGLYTFTLTDRIGNAVSFTVYLDSEVSYTLSDSYVTLDDGSVLSNKQQKVTISEEYNHFALVGEDGAEYGNEELLTKSGAYLLNVTDNFGNNLELTIILDFEAPILTLPTVNAGLSNSSVTVTCDDLEARIERIAANGTVLSVLQNGSVLSAEENYTLRVTDLAGNVSTYSFRIDKHLDYKCSAENGLFTTAAVSFVFSETITQKAVLNGEEIPSSLKYSAPGEYSVTLTDLAGNSETLNFSILEGRFRAFIVEDINGFSVVGISAGGTDMPSEPRRICLEDSGVYNITLSSDRTATTYRFTVEVDNTPPELTIEESGGNIKFANLSKQNVTALLYCNGAVVEGFDLKSTVSERGSYKLILTDDVGNVQIYEFEIKLTLNAFSIVIIVLASVLLIAVIVLIIRGHRIKAA